MIKRLINIFAYAPFEKILIKATHFATAAKLTGDYLEFGVYEGRSFIAAYHFAQKAGLKSMKFYAFDSFEGLPEITGVDANGFYTFKKGDYSCGEEKFKKNLSKNRVDLNKVTLIPGWYDKTLNQEIRYQLPIKKAAIVWIDCDLYESTVPILDFITDYLQDGTIIIFDDWFEFRGNPNRGQQRAFKEWLVKNPEIIVSEFHKFAWSGNSFIIHK